MATAPGTNSRFVLRARIRYIYLPDRKISLLGLQNHIEQQVWSKHTFSCPFGHLRLRIYLPKVWVRSPGVGGKFCNAANVQVLLLFFTDTSLGFVEVSGKALT